MPSSGIVAIDPSNNDTAVIDASNLSAVPEECQAEQHETSEEASQQDEDQAVSPMPLKKAPMVTPRTDRKVTTSAGGSSSSNAPISHTPEPSKGKSKKKVAVATPVAAEESSSPTKKSKKSKKANSVPMKTMKHFFGKAGTAKTKKDNAKPTAAKIQGKKDDKQAKKGVDTSSAEPTADNEGDVASKAEAKSVDTVKKSKAKTKSKSTQENPPAAKKAKKAASKKSSVDVISLEDMDDSPMDALAIVSRNMSAGRRSRVTTKSAPEGQKIEKTSSSKEAEEPVESGKEATIAPKNSPKTDEIVSEVKESTPSSASSPSADKVGKEAVVDSPKGKVVETSECDDDATVAMDDSDTPASIELDMATSVEKDNSLSDSPVDEVGCTEEVIVEKESDKGTCTEEKDTESGESQPAVIVIDEPTPEKEAPKEDDSTNTAEVAPSKKKRDPNAPKKPKSALNFYQIAKRNEFKAANPDMKAGEITKLMSAEYKKLDANDKLVWEEQAKEDKLRYKNEMAAYKPSEQPSNPKNDDNTSTAKEPAAKKEKPSILAALASCPPKSKGDNPKKKAVSTPTSKATSDPKPALSEEERSHLQKFAALSEKYNLRAEQLKSRPASDDFTEESLDVKNADLPSLDKGSVEVDGTFPDQLLPYLMVIAQGSALPLSSLSEKALQELSVYVKESHPLSLELVSSKIKLLAQRKSFLNAPSQLDCFENDEEGYMWRWELSSIDLLPSKDATKVKKARAARRKLQSHHKAITNLISAIEKAVSSIETKSSSSQKLIAKVSDMEEKVLKFEREEETARLLNKAKAQKKAAENAKKEEEKEEKERKKMEAAKEREAAKQKKAEEKEKEKLAKQQELEEKENKRKARMMSFFSKGSATKKQKLVSTPPNQDSSACKESSTFDSDSLRRLIDSQSKHISTPFAKVQRKRKTQNVRVSVFVTAVSDNPFSQQPYDEEKIITVPNAYKFLGFHEDVRPPYHGTWSKTSSIVTGRNPFGQDKSILDYEVDSEAEWEEGDDEHGEDLNEDVGEEEEDEGPQDEDNDGWLAAEDDLGDDEDEETRELRKRKLQLETNLQKSGHYKACVVAPQMGGIPHSAECEITLVEGFSPANAFDVLCSHVSCIISPDIDSICLDAFAPTDSAKNSDQTKDSSVAQSDEITSEAKRIVAQFVHNCTVNSKEKLVTELLVAHPSITKSRAKAIREVDFMAEKTRVPKEAGGGVLWKVKPDLLKTLGLEEKDLKQAPEVTIPPKVQDANLSPMAQTGTKSVENTSDSKKKKKKDPNAPKKPKSSFMYFSNAKRAEVKAANPEASFGDIGKLLGIEWKQLSNDAKTEYEKLAEADKVRYQKEMENYSPPLDDSSASKEDVGEKKKAEVKKDQSLKKSNPKSTPSPNDTGNSTKKRKTPPVSVASANLFAAFLKKKKKTE